MCMVEGRGLGCVVVGRDLAKALSFCFFFAIVGRRCVNGGVVLLLIVGDNFIFLIFSDWVGSLFLFWPGMMGLGSAFVVGLVRLLSNSLSWQGLGPFRLSLAQGEMWARFDPRDDSAKLFKWS